MSKKDAEGRDAAGRQTLIRKFLKSGERKIKERRLKDAVDDLLEAAELDPENPEVHYYLGIAYARMERYDDAVFHLERLTASELSYINRVHARMILGYIYAIKEDFPKALENFRDIVKAGFNSAQAYAAIGYVMDRMGNFKEAVMNLYRALEIEPNNANAHNSLGYIFASANVNLEQALAECRKAVNLDPENPAYLDSLGWVYYKLGKHNQAKSYLLKALKGSPGNEEIMRHLAAVTDAANAGGRDLAPSDRSPAGRGSTPGDPRTGP